MSWGNLREKYTASLTASESIVANIDVTHVERVSVEVSVSGDPLNSFSLHGRFHPAGSYRELYASAEDYTSPSGLLIGTSGDLSSLGGIGWFILDTRALDVLQIKSSSFSETALNLFVGG